MRGCLFCKIVKGQIPATIIYEDDQVMAFRDIAPHAPVHLLVIPKKHIASLSEASAEDLEILGHIQLTLARLAKEMGVAEGGYRVVNNCGSDGGQTVFHIHYHLLGGRELKWPPG